MATSGDISFELTGDQIISAALRKLGVLAKGQTADAEDLSNGRQALNGLITLFSTDGMPLWKREELLVPLTVGITLYTLTGALKVAQVVIQELSSEVEWDLINRSEYDLNRLPTSTGVPVHYGFTPEISTGTLRIWPAPDASAAASYRLLVEYQRKFDGFVAGGNTPDFPSFWTDALVYGLAVRLAPEYGVPLQDRQMLMKEAEMYRKMAADYGDEDGSLFIMQDKWGR